MVCNATNNIDVIIVFGSRPVAVLGIFDLIKAIYFYIKILKVVLIEPNTTITSIIFVALHTIHLLVFHSSCKSCWASDKMR